MRSCAFAQKVKFYALQMLKKQNLTHPKAAKLATLELNGECDLTLLSVTSCDCHFSTDSTVFTLTNFPDKYLMRSSLKDSKYLGVTISDNLDWSKHITTTTTKANARLSFIKRNLKEAEGLPTEVKGAGLFLLGTLLC